MKTVLIAILALAGTSLITPEAEAHERRYRHSHRSSYHHHNQYRHYPRSYHYGHRYYRPTRSYYYSSYGDRYYYPRTYYRRPGGVSLRFSF